MAARKSMFKYKYMSAMPKNFSLPGLKCPLHIPRGHRYKKKVHRKREREREREKGSFMHRSSSHGTIQCVRGGGGRSAVIFLPPPSAAASGPWHRKFALSECERETQPTPPTWDIGKSKHWGHLHRAHTHTHIRSTRS